MIYCTHCGKQLHEDAKFCQDCGASNSHVVGNTETAAQRIGNDSMLQQHWVRRFIAIVIDSIIIVIATTIIGYVTNLVGIFNWLSFPFAMGLMYVLYFTITESWYGCTVGKGVVNLKVVTETGSKPSLESAFVRNISKIHVIFLIFDAIGGFFISKDPHQKYIDQIAHTTVVQS